MSWVVHVLDMWYSCIHEGCYEIEVVMSFAELWQGAKADGDIEGDKVRRGIK
jgi:hypothetical protein